VSPKSVVGHSSGEIAGAYAAGLLTAEEAIKIAYFRGQACTTSQDKVELGMLAAGLGAEQVRGYLNEQSQLVQIACYNSPNSVTLSGNRSELEKIKDCLVNDGHFCANVAGQLCIPFEVHCRPSNLLSRNAFTKLWPISARKAGCADVLFCNWQIIRPKLWCGLLENKHDFPCSF